MLEISMSPDHERLRSYPDRGRTCPSTRERA